MAGPWEESTVHRVLIDPRRLGTGVEGAGVQVTVRVRPLTTSMGCSTQCKEESHRTVGGTKLQQRITTSLRWGNDRHGGPSRGIAGPWTTYPMEQVPGWEATGSMMPVVALTTTPRR